MFYVQFQALTPSIAGKTVEAIAGQSKLLMEAIDHTTNLIGLEDLDGEEGPRAVSGWG